MIDVKRINISTLGLSGGLIEISNSIDCIYVIDSSANIVVKEGVNASFIDTLRNSNVKLTVERLAVVNYLVLDSVKTNRVFDVYGELQMTEILLEETNESLRVNLDEENSSCNISCLSIASGMFNNFVQYVSHNKPETFSNIKNVGVSMMGSKIVFDTTGKILKGMSKSKCAQLSRGIVMDDKSSVTAKPILLIDEYDCFANHGASIGKMSDEDLFYLMSRGLSKKDAFLLILKGIIHPFIESIKIDEIKERIEKEVSNLIEK